MRKAIKTMPVIPAQPTDFSLPAPGRFALVIIDMQRDFLEPGGFGESLGNDVHRLRPIVPVLQRLLVAFRMRGFPVIHTIEGHHPDLTDCPPAKLRRGKDGSRIGDPGPMGRILVLGEPGNAIIPELAPVPGELVLTKPGKGAFCRTDFENMLRVQAITHLLVGGVTTEVCVQTTLREANDRGFECLLIEDATESYFPEFKQSTLEMVRAQGGIVASTAQSSDILKAIGLPEIPAASPPAGLLRAVSAAAAGATPTGSPSATMHTRLALPLGLSHPRNLFPIHP